LGLELLRELSPLPPRLHPILPGAFCPSLRLSSKPGQVHDNYNDVSPDPTSPWPPPWGFARQFELVRRLPHTNSSPKPPSASKICWVSGSNQAGSLAGVRVTV